MFTVPCIWLVQNTYLVKFLAVTLIFELAHVAPSINLAPRRHSCPRERLYFEGVGVKVLSLDFGHLHPHIGLDVPYNKLRNIVLQRVNWPTYIQREHVKFNIQYLIKCASVIIIFLHHIH